MEQQQQPANVAELHAMFTNHQKILIAFRIRLDEVCQSLEKNPFSPYTMLALREIQKARMHLGWGLISIGAVNPYYNVENAADIPPPSDKYEGPILHVNPVLENGKLDYLQQLRTILEEVHQKLTYNSNIQPVEMGAAVSQVRYAHAWLGYAIGEIRKKFLRS